MKCEFIAVLVMSAIFSGCSSTSKSPDVADAIRKSLDAAGYKSVKISQDRVRGVVTLSGQVSMDADRMQAEQLARTIAAGQVIADEILVLPPGQESEAKAVSADVDKAIEKLFDAALIENHLQKSVKYSSKAGVLTLTGDVDSQALRDQVQTLAAAIPNVQQVVNEIQVKNQKATGTN